MFQFKGRLACASAYVFAGVVAFGLVAVPGCASSELPVFTEAHADHPASATAPSAAPVAGLTEFSPRAVLAERAAPPQATATTAPTAGKYVCPIHPNVTSDEPGKCPECGMKLKARAALSSTAEDAHGHG